MSHKKMGNNSTLFELQKNALNCDRVANKYKYKYFSLIKQQNT